MENTENLDVPENQESETKKTKYRPRRVDEEIVVKYTAGRNYNDFRVTKDRLINSLHQLTEDDTEFALRRYIAYVNKTYHKRQKVLKRGETEYDTDLNIQANAMYKDMIKNLIVFGVEKYGSFTKFRLYLKSCNIGIRATALQNVLSSKYTIFHFHQFLLIICSTGISLSEVVSSVAYLHFDPLYHLKDEVREKKLKIEPVKKVKRKGFAL